VFFENVVFGFYMSETLDYVPISKFELWLKISNVQPVWTRFSFSFKQYFGPGNREQHSIGDEVK
jgi:hypothetical protein